MQQTPSGHNPYAPPVAAGMANAQTATGAPLDWEIGEVLSQAWGIFKQHALVLILAPFVAFLCIFAMSFVAQLGIVAVADNALLSGLLSLVVAVTQFAVEMFFIVGLIRIFVAAARGETPEFGTTFSGGDRVLPLFLNQLLLSIIATIGFVLLIVPGIIVSIGLSFAAHFCTDRQMGPVEALRKSWEVTDGQKVKLFLFGLAAVGIGLLGALACLVGLFVALPLIGLASSIIYTRLSGTASGPALPGGAPPAWGGGPMPGAPPVGASPAMGQPMSAGAGMQPMPPPGAPQGGYPGAHQGYGGAPQGGYPGAPQGGGYPGAPQGGGYPGAPQGGGYPGAPQAPGAPQGGGYPGAPQGGGYPGAPQGGDYPGGMSAGVGPAAPPGVGGVSPTQPGPTQSGPGPTQPGPGPTQPGSPRPGQQRVGPGGTQIIQQFDPSKLEKK